MSPSRLLAASAKRLLRWLREPDLLIRAKAELLKEMKADPALVSAARQQALAEIKTRPEMTLDCQRELLSEVVERALWERERAAAANALGFVDLCDFTETDLDANRKVLESFARLATFQPQSLNWFVPHFDHVLRGGIRTIIAFADYFRQAKGVRNRIIVYGRRSTDPSAYHQQIQVAFPDFPAEDVLAYSGDDPAMLPPADAAIATLWTSAYHVLRVNDTTAKFYLVQDYEPLFYSAGTMSALIEATYRFGFWGICNTPGVADAYRRVSGAPTQAFVPAVDRSVYYPLDPSQPKHAEGEPKTLVFYGRPGNDRNCFELGVRALRSVKRLLGDGVRIISVGAKWEPGQYDLDGVVENWGLLGTLEEVADLYRHCDAGLCFMQTPHPSYQPLEYMACGCPTVTNRNPANAWLLRHGENCLLAEPTASAVAEAVVGLLQDDELSARIIRNGLLSVGSTDWQQQMDIVFDFICKKTPAASEGRS